MFYSKISHWQYAIKLRVHWQRLDETIYSSANLLFIMMVEAAAKN